MLLTSRGIHPFRGRHNAAMIHCVRRMLERVSVVLERKNKRYKETNLVPKVLPRTKRSTAVVYVRGRPLAALLVRISRRVQAPSYCADSFRKEWRNCRCRRFECQEWRSGARVRFITSPLRSCVFLG